MSEEMTDTEKVSLFLALEKIGEKNREGMQFYSVSYEDQIKLRELHRYLRHEICRIALAAHKNLDGENLPSFKEE